MKAGWLAGVSQATLTYPLEVVRTRLSIDKQMGGTYKGIIDCAAQTIRAEGVTALYKGYIMTFISTPVYVGLQMSLYQYFLNNAPKTEDGKTPIYQKLICGACAGLIAQTTAYPGDTIKKQLQSNGVHGEKPKFKGLIDCVSQIIRKEGVRGLYPGLTLNSIKCLPEAGIQFAVYEFMKDLLSFNKN